MAVVSEPPNDADKIIVNVSGSLFEVKEDLLKQFPQTLLGSPTKRVKFYDPYRKQYFFDRHRIAFEAILFFYQSGGRVSCPENVPKEVFEDEIKYFEIPENENSETYKAIILGIKMDTDNLHPCQRKLWELFEFPKSSKAAKWLGIWSQFIVVLSIVNSCLRTEKYLQEYFAKQFNQDSKSERLDFHFAKNLWFAFDLICYGWFSLECGVRALASPKKLACFRTWIGIIDFSTIFFFYILLALKVAIPEVPKTAVNVLDMFCLVRVFKLLRYSENFQVLVSTFISGASELRHLIIFAVIFMVFSSTVIHFVELEESKTTFTSIPKAFWWSIVTITTIGYGDMTPMSTGGKIIASFSALFGTLVIALPLFRFAGKLRLFLRSTEERVRSHNLIRTKSKNNIRNGINENPSRERSKTMYF